MNLFILSWHYIKGKKLNTFLNTLLLGFGIAIIVVLLLVGHQLQQQFSKNSQGIDLVVGAKGSPLQIILCNVFHIDFPTGNIKLKEAVAVSKNRLVKEVIPLALGDSYMTIRIVGTNQDYVQHYALNLREGKLWERTLEATLGATAASTLQLKVGDTFIGEHGLAEGAHQHDEHVYTVVGVFEKSGTVADNLILTSIESVWLMHEEHEEEGVGDDHEHEHHDHDAADPHDHSQHDHSKDVMGIHIHGEMDDKEITSMIVKYRSPMAAVQLPRIVNAIGTLQAASPAFEMARLLTIIGVGMDVVQGFAYLIIFIAGLSVFIALYNSLRERKYDLAIMRALGASKSKLLLHILLEGVIITLLGSTFGFILGHGVVELIGRLATADSQLVLTGYLFLKSELWIIIGGIVLGIVASLIPAISAYKTDISSVLAEG